jgi:acyl carrier protein
MTSPDQPTETTADGFRRFAGIVGRQVGLDLSAAEPDSRLHDQLGFDSLAMAEVLVLLADRGVHLPDELIPELRTLGDLHHYAVVLTPAHPSAPAAPVGPGRGPSMAVAVGSER